MGFMDFLKGKEQVQGRVVLPPAAPSGPQGLAIFLYFLKVEKNAPAPQIGVHELTDAMIAGSVLVITHVKMDFELELPAGSYQVLARINTCEIEQGTRVTIDEQPIAELRPLPRAFEVVKGVAKTIRVPITPPAIVRRQEPAMPAFAIAWATDGRMFTRECPGLPDLDRRTALLPQAFRHHFQEAVALGNAERPDQALVAYGQAWEAVPPAVQQQVPEWRLEVDSGRAMCFLQLGRGRDALRALSPHLAPGRSVRATPRSMAVSLLGTMAHALLLEGERDQMERCVNLALNISAGDAQDARSLGLAVDARTRAIDALSDDPERLLEMLDKHTLVLGDPASDIAGGRARFDALVALGRTHAARTFGRQLLPTLQSQGQPVLAKELQAAIAALPPGMGSNPTLSIISTTGERRKAEGAAGEKLIAAGSTGDIAALTTLAADPEGIDAAGTGFRTALAMAAFCGKGEAVAWLVAHGAAVDKTNADSRTPMMLAADQGHAPVVAFLLSKGARVDEQDLALQTALHLASWQNHLATVEVLLKAGASFSLVDISGRTALQLAATEDVPEVVDLLVRGGSAVNAQSPEGHTALMCAAMEGKAGVVEVLLRHKADRALVDRAGMTAADWARQENHAAALALLQ